MSSGCCLWFWSMEEEFFLERIWRWGGFGSARQLWTRLLSSILGIPPQLVGIWLKSRCRQDELCSLCRVARPSEGDDSESAQAFFPLRCAQTRDDCGDSASHHLLFASPSFCHATGPGHSRTTDIAFDGRTLRTTSSFLLILSGNNLTSIGLQFSRPVSPRLSSEVTSSARPSRVSERLPSSP